MKKKVKILVAAFIIAVTCIIYSNKHIDVTKYDISDNQIPKTFDGYKIAQISDLHSVNNWFQADKKSLLRKLKKNDPDIIVMTGDMVDNDDQKKKTITYEFVEECTKIAPVYYVTGNHETTLKKSLDAFLESINDIDNVQVLRNKTVEIVKDDDRLVILGIDDPALLKHNTTIRKTICGLKQGYENEYVILLAHRPERIDDYVNNDVDLVFTGHSHGGQIRIPFVGGVFAPNQGLWPKYTSGVIDKDDIKMIISRGVGNSTSMFAKIRFNNSPELVIATLHCE